ncbi:MAG: FkbM family methyltransferase [Myxococcales bacterium]|nr:FkbM family methyltransferase [Myxococcales bacterium]
MGLWRRIASRTPRFRLDAEVDKLHLGTTYGGYAVVPHALSETSVVYSFGVGQDVSFDLALIERFGAEVHAFDPTPRSLAWVEQQSFPARFVFHSVGVAGADGTLTLHAPPHEDHVSFSPVARKGSGGAVEVPVKTVRTLMTELGHERVDLLKADVEGAEYDVIADLLDNGPRPGQLLLEFHHHLPTIPLSRTKQAIADLRAAGYLLFDQSEAGAEMSFVHRDLR